MLQGHTEWYTDHMSDDITTIDPSKVSEGLHKYAGQWVALSVDHKVVGNGRTYQEVVRSIKRKEGVALFPIPQADIALAP